MWFLPRGLHPSSWFPGSSSSRPQTTLPGRDRPFACPWRCLKAGGIGWGKVHSSSHCCHFTGCSPGPRGPPPTVCRAGCCKAVWRWASVLPHRGLALGRSPGAAVHLRHRPRSTGKAKGCRGRWRRWSGLWQGLRLPLPTSQKPPRPHLPPGGCIPAEAGLGGTGLASGWLGGSRLAVEGPQRPEVPRVHTLHVPHRESPTAAAGALGTEGHMCRLSHVSPIPHTHTNTPTVEDPAPGVEGGGGRKGSIPA